MSRLEDLGPGDLPPPRCPECNKLSGGGWECDCAIKDDRSHVFCPACSKKGDELEKWQLNWLYENLEIPHPDGVLYGIRQLVSMLSNEKLLRKKMEEEQPFWLWFAALQFCAKHKCEQSSAFSCSQTDKCITEYCPPCAAKKFLEKMPNNIAPLRAHTKDKEVK